MSYLCLQFHGVFKAGAAKDIIEKGEVDKPQEERRYAYINKAGLVHLIMTDFAKHGLSLQ